MVRQPPRWYEPEDAPRSTDPMDAAKTVEDRARAARTPGAALGPDAPDVPEPSNRGAPDGMPGAEDDVVTVGDLVQGAQKAVSTAGSTARRWVDRGRYRKVRVSRHGKPVMPDLPVAAVAAAEAATLYSVGAAGFARVLAAHISAKFLFDIEIVNEADRYFNVGVERFLEGDLERAEDALLRAVHVDDTHAAAYLQLGVLYRMRRDLDRARPVLERAVRLDPAGELGRKAGDILRALERG